ncbi:GtrA family protein [Flavimobilis sp. GY10621]|uniref:GtrA family protein n=1 Tax=Flavimobilis rhizosphaerae TaxID=2775421 RepID=A0ABR9DM25_9MICO|nr:GtrA family protein [Flavimobilis rhizosphaerae]MBD9698175.1 GtrA family protein [Flavimobilis rhizosphaerae]
MSRRPGVITGQVKHWMYQVTGVLVAGGVGWIVDVALLWVLDTRVGLPTSVAAATAFLASGVANFLINRAVFRTKHGSARRTQLFRYAVLLLANTLAVSLLVPLLAHPLSASTGNWDVALLLGKALTTALILPLNVLGYRAWVFSSSSDQRVRDNESESPR